MVGRNEKRTIDLTEVNINLDELLDVYVSVQKESGIDVGMIENEVDIDSNGHVHKTPIMAKKQNTDKPRDECAKCSKKCSSDTTEAYKPSDDDYYSSLPVNRLGRFADCKSSEIADDNDEDDTYICEYCTEIGFKKVFTPYLCESCTACEGCSEYEAEECSGCTYSRYRTGRPYSEELRIKGKDVKMSEDEVELLEILLDEVDSSDRESVDKGFTVADHDHRY